MADIFISYSRKDQSQLIPVVEQLRKRGFEIWIDTEGIQGAKLWSQEIVTAIESSKVLILFASSKAFLSKNVTKEVALASESEKHILPVFLDNAQIPAAMKYQLAGIQHLVHEKGQNSQTVDNNLHTLQDIRYKKRYKAENGYSGGGSNKTGKNGKDIIILVPAGSVVREKGSNEIIVDLTKDGQKHIICHGGKGGKGNARFKTSTKPTIDICLLS